MYGRFILRLVLLLFILIHCIACTVVPALGDPRRERPPAVYGHFVNVPTHFNVKLPLISGHLPNADADSIYWLSAPAIMDSANKCHVFGGHFNQKSLARTQTCDQQFVKISVLSSGDQRAICNNNNNNNIYDLYSAIYLANLAIHRR